MNQILVTGGLGYIGSHTCVELFASGFEPIIIDDLSNSSISVLDGLKKIIGFAPKFEHIDLKNKERVSRFFDIYPDIKGIIHFAAHKAVEESVEQPIKYYKNNLYSLIHLLEECEKRSIRNFIFSSSCTVYGDTDQMPLTEQSPILSASSPYGNTKQIGEEIIQDVVQNEKMQAISLRYFNPIGAHPSAHIGELPIGIPQNLIPFMTQTAAKIRDELSVFGNDYPTKDGTCIRDYIYILDLAKAHICALKRLMNKKNKSLFEPFNVGAGTGNSVLEVIQAFEQATNQKLKHAFAPRRKGDVVVAYADTSKANSELNWKADTLLKDALKTAWAWQKTLL